MVELAVRPTLMPKVRNFIPDSLSLKSSRKLQNGLIIKSHRLNENVSYLTEAPLNKIRFSFNLNCVFQSFLSNTDSIFVCELTWMQLQIGVRSIVYRIVLDGNLLHYITHIRMCVTLSHQRKKVTSMFLHFFIFLRNWNWFHFTKCKLFRLLFIISWRYEKAENSLCM